MLKGRGGVVGARVGTFLPGEVKGSQKMVVMSKGRNSIEGEAIEARG